MLAGKCHRSPWFHRKDSLRFLLVRISAGPLVTIDHDVPLEQDIGYAVNTARERTSLSIILWWESNGQIHSIDRSSGHFPIRLLVVKDCCFLRYEPDGVLHSRPDVSLSSRLSPFSTWSDRSVRLPAGLTCSKCLILRLHAAQCAP
jgi:hypothetical protein